MNIRDQLEQIEPTTWQFLDENNKLVTTYESAHVKLLEDLLVQACEALKSYSHKRHPVYQDIAKETLSSIESKLEKR